MTKTYIPREVKFREERIRVLWLNSDSGLFVMFLQVKHTVKHQNKLIFYPHCYFTVAISSILYTATGEYCICSVGFYSERNKIHKLRPENLKSLIDILRMC